MIIAGLDRAISVPRTSVPRTSPDLGTKAERPTSKNGKLIQNVDFGGALSNANINTNHTNMIDKPNYLLHLFRRALRFKDPRVAHEYVPAFSRAAARLSRGKTHAHDLKKKTPFVSKEYFLSLPSNKIFERPRRLLRKGDKAGPATPPDTFPVSPPSAPRVGKSLENGWTLVVGRLCVPVCHEEGRRATIFQRESSTRCERRTIMAVLVY